MIIFQNVGIGRKKIVAVEDRPVLLTFLSLAVALGNDTPQACNNRWCYCIV